MKNEEDNENKEFAFRIADLMSEYHFVHPSIISKSLISMGAHVAFRCAPNMEEAKIFINECVQETLDIENSK